MSQKIALVVDDSKSARFALRKALESFGYRVDTADSADDAYLYLRSKHPDVIFLDHLMPGCDGFEALRELKRNPRTAGLPVVLCSSNEGEEFVRRARAAGAAEVLPKPVGAEQLGAVLERLEGVCKPAPSAVPQSKVQPIREPEVAIEQAVMRSLKAAWPSLHAGAARAETPARRAEPAPQPDTRREEMDAHLRELATRAVELQLDAAVQQLETQLAELRADFHELVRLQNQRIDQLGASLRQAVVEEAQAVAERAVMNAAARISSQLADSILHALRQNAARA